MLPRAPTGRSAKLSPSYLADRYPDRVSAVALDVCDAEQCEAAVAHAVDRFGGVDVLVNNAGAGLFGAVRKVSDDELRAQLEVLTVAPWRLTRLVLPLMHRQGHVVNVSSIAGRMGLPGLSAYVAGKYALEGMSQALAAEVAPFGIRVHAVEPGGFATHYSTSLAEAAGRIQAYAQSTGDVEAALRGMPGHPGLSRPEVFAHHALRLVASPTAPLRVPIGADAYDFLEAVEATGRAELAAAQAFVHDAVERPGEDAAPVAPTV